MLIPIQDPKRQYILLKEAIDRCVLAVLESGRWLSGEQVEAFQTSFGRYCGVKYVYSVANGTDALEIALVAAGAKGREVITVANAGGYTTTACRIIGAIPVYVDIDPDRLLMSSNAALAAVTPQTAAIVVTHLYGRLADIQTLRAGLVSIRRQDIKIIEDCAQAHGAAQNSHLAGSLGDIGVFSFYPTKNLGAMGDGGAIVCSNDDLASFIMQLRQYGWSKRYHSVVPYGRNSRMDEIQAAILLVKLPHLNEWNARRRQIVQQYSTAAPKPLAVWFDNSSAFVAHLAIARHPDRDRIRKGLQSLGVMTDIHYPILDCDQPSQLGLPSVTHDLRVTRQAVNEIFTLPCFSEMTDGEIDYLCECLQKME